MKRELLHQLISKVRWTNYNISIMENDVNDHPPSSLTSTLLLQFHFLRCPATPGPELLGVTFLLLP
jgi:hypothetical protein